MTTNPFEDAIKFPTKRKPVRGKKVALQSSGGSGDTPGLYVRIIDLGGKHPYEQVDRALLRHFIRIGPAIRNSGATVDWKAK